LDEVALVLRLRIAARDDARALGLALLDVRRHAVALRLGDERSESGRLVEGVTDGERLRRLPRNLDGLVVLRLVDEHARPCRAGLAGVEVAVADAYLHGLRQVGVGKDDVGGLAAE